jgi:hypothetical protein
VFLFDHLIAVYTHPLNVAARGLGDGASDRMLALLVGRDVGAPAAHAKEA